MTLNIANKDYELYYGLDFIRAINDLRGLKVEAENGVEINTKAQGVTFLIQGLENYDPTAVFDLIKAGTSTEKSKPSNKDINAFIDDLIDADETGETYKDFVDEELAGLKNSRYTKLAQKLNG